MGKIFNDEGFFCFHNLLPFILFISFFHFCLTTNTVHPFRDRSPSLDLDSLFKVPIEHGLFDDIDFSKHFHSNEQKKEVHHLSSFHAIDKVHSISQTLQPLYAGEHSKYRPEENFINKLNKVNPKNSLSQKSKILMFERAERTRLNRNSKKRLNRARMKIEDPKLYRTIRDEENSKRRNRVNAMNPFEQEEFKKKENFSNNLLKKSRLTILKLPGNEHKLEKFRESRRIIRRRQYKREKEKLKEQNRFNFKAI